MKILEVSIFTSRKGLILCTTKNENVFTSHWNLSIFGAIVDMILCFTRESDFSGSSKKKVDSLFRFLGWSLTHAKTSKYHRTLFSERESIQRLPTISRMDVLVLHRWSPRKDVIFHYKMKSSRGRYLSLKEKVLARTQGRVFVTKEKRAKQKKEDRPNRNGPIHCPKKYQERNDCLGCNRNQDHYIFLIEVVRNIR